MTFLKQASLFLAASLFASCSTNSIHEIDTYSPNSNVPSEVKEYVTKHRDWNHRDYRIEREGKAEGYASYVVTYIPEEKTYRIGGGKSFAVYYDPVRRRVVKEMHFQ